MVYYYMTQYSFDADIPVVGPYKTDDECWKAMQKDAEKEYRIDTEENEWDTQPLDMNQDEGVITLNNIFRDRVDTTTWTLIQVPNQFSEEKMHGIYDVLDKSGLSAEQVKDTFKKICDILS